MSGRLLEEATVDELVKALARSTKAVLVSAVVQDDAVSERHVFRHYGPPLLCMGLATDAAEQMRLVLHLERIKNGSKW